MARDRNPEGTNRKRTVEIRLKLSPALAEKFAAVAEQRGLLPATLAAVVIGEYLEKKDESALLQSKVAIQVSTLMAESFTPEKLAAIIEHSMADPGLIQLINSMQQVEEGKAAQAVSSAAPEAAADVRTGASPTARPNG